jgi:protein CpxP
LRYFALVHLSFHHTKQMAVCNGSTQGVLPMKVKSMMVMLLSAGLLLAQPVLAGPDEGHRGGPQGSQLLKGLKGLKGLDLTDAQRAQIKTLMENARATLPARDTMQSSHQAMQALIKAPQFDAVAARQLLEAQQDKQLEAQLARLKLQHDIRAVLTDEQKAKLDERQAKMLERRQQKDN